MKKFLIIILWLIPIPFIIISINYFVDPANLFNKNYEKGIADYLSKGYNVTNVVNYNERLLQKYFIENMKKCPKTIALGSSRIMQINSKSLKEDNFINNGVSGASLEDDIAIYYLYEKKRFKVQKVILGIDPWLLNDNNNQGRWKDLRNEYFDFVNMKLKQETKIDHKIRLLDFLKFEELLSSSYFKTSLEYLFKGINKEYKPTKYIINDGFTRLSDGSIYYDKLYRSASFDKVESEAKNCIASKPIYSLGNFINLSESYKFIFTNFIEYLQKQNIEVVFFLSPYHPIVYDYFKKNEYYHIVFKTENYFNNFASAHSIKVIGSYDPSKYSFDNSYFFDGLHCNEKAINKILNNDN